MSGQNNFQSLKQYATKEYKFKQGRSLALLDPATAAKGGAINAVALSSTDYQQLKDGICAVLAADWLREKLTSGDSYVGADFGGPGVHAGENLTTVVNNVPKMIAYKKLKLTSNALGQHGLSSTYVGDPRVVSTTLKERKGQNYLDRIINFAQTLAKACTAEYLKKGRGVWISFELLKANGVGDGGHAVAAYRSRGNTLYFFDCNCGVYNVTDPDRFFDEYVAIIARAFGRTCKLEDIAYVDR
jgi:hypothetical protein